MNAHDKAKLLVKESFDAEGAVDATRVSAVCDYIEQNIPSASQAAVLREYAKILAPVLARESAKVEISGEISEDAFAEIRKFVEEQSGGRKLRFEKVENPKLLGGVRITCGDNIWESSVKSALDTLRPASQR